MTTIAPLSRLCFPTTLTYLTHARARTGTKKQPAASRIKVAAVYRCPTLEDINSNIYLSLALSDPSHCAIIPPRTLRCCPSSFISLGCVPETPARSGTWASISRISSPYPNPSNSQNNNTYIHQGAARQDTSVPQPRLPHSQLLLPSFMESAS